MKPKRFAVFTLMIALTASLPLVAHAQLADPGFSYVDVNNDGLYTPGNGDIPITPSILSAIQSSGSFDTQQSIPGIYQAPECPASLIIPASQQLAFPTPLFLQAGENVVIHGSITAPALALCTDDDGQADLTGATVNVNSSLQVYAEEGVILDGSAISCSDPDSEVHVCTDDQVSAIGASIFTGMELSIRAEDGVDMDNASIYAQSADSMVKVCSDGGIQANSFITAGTVRFRADDGGITLNNGAITANSVRLCSDGQTDVSGSFFTVNGPMKLAGDDGVLGITSAISATQLCVEGDCGVDFSQSSLYASAGPIWMQSDDGPISLNAAYVSSAGGLAACSDGGVDVTSASISADCYNSAICRLRLNPGGREFHLPL